MEERKFKVKVKMKDDRKESTLTKTLRKNRKKMIKDGTIVPGQKGALLKAITKQKRAKSDKASKAAWKKANPTKTHYSDYKPPIHGKRKN